MICVFGSFVLNGDPTVKQFGSGCRLRCSSPRSLVLVLAPALLGLFGGYTWQPPALASIGCCPTSGSRSRCASSPSLLLTPWRRYGEKPGRPPPFAHHREVQVDDTMYAKMKSGKGFIAALDQSGGSTPKALGLYGIDESAYSGEAEMFDLMHQMRSRIITSPVLRR